MRGKRITTNEFIEMAKKVHGDKYDYFKTEYTNSKTKVCIICPIHGEFYQLPYKHLSGQKCSKCSKKYNYTTEEWVETAKTLHYRDNFDYSKVNYVNNHTKVCIICPIHGDFHIRPNDFLNGQGCKQCGIERDSKRKLSNTQEFIEKAIKKYGNKYDYKKVNYINSVRKVCITCSEHGDFYISPNSFLNGCGCRQCGLQSRISKRKLPLNDFLIKANAIHKNKYDYSKVQYINTDTKVTIICPKHGEFSQTPHAHLNGQGCPKCYRSIMEEKVHDILSERYISFEEQKTFPWLRNKISLRLDFYLTDYNIGIECQGRQHFGEVPDFKGAETYEVIVKRDTKKKELCDKYGVELFYYNYNDKARKEKIVKLIYDRKYKTN